MSRISGKNTKPEILVRHYLFAKGFRYRLHVKDLPGKPDIVLPKYNTLIFVHGCFWHGHENCKYFVIPKTRTDWWLDKINRNKGNDLKNQEKLTGLGWNIINLWECELKKNRIEDTMQQCIAQLADNLSQKTSIPKP